jgi:hypothetical protein
MKFENNREIPNDCRFTPSNDWMNCTAPMPNDFVSIFGDNVDNWISLLSGTGRNSSQDIASRDRPENTCESLQFSVDWSLLPNDRHDLAPVARNTGLKNEHLRELLSLALDENSKSPSNALPRV